MQPAPSNPRSAAAGGPDDRKSNRVPLERQVSMRFEDFEGFVSECSMNISATGMFIRCQNPQPAGSVLDFEFSLTGGENLIRGYGEVMWARRRDAGPDHPAGMGIRFLHLDAESRELIRWTVTRRYITGAGPCNLDEIKSAMRRAADEESATRQERPAPGMAGVVADIAIPPEPGEARPRYLEAGFAAVAAERHRRRPLRLVLPAAALALGGLYFLRVPSPVDAIVHEGVDEVVAIEPAAEKCPQPPFFKGGSQNPSQGESDDVGAKPASPTAPTAVTAPTEQTAAELAADWARAWSEQRATDYLSCYAATFRPPRGLTRHAWEEQRRVRILRPRKIVVALSGVTAETLGPERARVRFQQTYQSDTYRDLVSKSLELVWEDGGWRILEERVEG